MCKYYKNDVSVLAVDSVAEWKGDTVIVLRVANTAKGVPLALEHRRSLSLERLYCPATEAEWMAGLAVAEKRQAELDKAAAKKADGEKYGIKVERYKRIQYGDTSIPDDTIVRCTKTQWIGLLGSYKRTVKYGSPGEMLREVGYGSSSVYLDDASLDALAKRADGRLVVDFVKEAKKAEALK